MRCLLQHSDRARISGLEGWILHRWDRWIGMVRGGGEGVWVGRLGGRRGGF